MRRGGATIASASISTFQRGSSRAATATIVAAGRICAEELAVDGADGLGVGGVGQQHAGADDVGERGAGLGERRLDDREAAAGLEGDVVGAGAVGEDGGGAGDEDPVADADGAGEADRGLEGGAGGDSLAGGHSSSPSSSGRAARRFSTDSGSRCSARMRRRTPGRRGQCVVDQASCRATWTSGAHDLIEQNQRRQ